MIEEQAKLPVGERIDYALAAHRATGLPILLSGGRMNSGGTPLAGLAADWLKDRGGVSPAAADVAQLVLETGGLR